MQMFDPNWILENPILSFAILFAEYVILMTIYHKTNKTGAKIAKVLAVPFVIQDALVNIFAVSLVFLEGPKLTKGEWLVTARLKRWKTLTKQDDRLFGWRRKFAWWMCDKLNKYDAGHC